MTNRAIRDLQGNWLTKIQQASPTTPILVTTAEDFKGTWTSIADSNADETIIARTISANEIVIESDKTWDVVYKVAKKVDSTCDELDIPHINTYSGNKSIHQHIFFDASGILVPDELGANIEEYNIDVASIARTTLTTYLLATADVSTNDIDFANINWSSNSKGSLIREIGAPRGNGLYKTAIDAIPATKPDPGELGLGFPDSISLWRVPTNLHEPVLLALQKAVTKAKEENQVNNRDTGNIINGNILDVLKTYNSTIQLTPLNDSSYSCAHPVHGSTTGSNFHIDSAKNIWHCFRCNSGGGILQLVAVLEGILVCSECTKGALTGEKYKKTIKIAKEKYGIEVANNNKDETTKALKWKIGNFSREEVVKAIEFLWSMQTPDEQVTKITNVENGEGFNKFDTDFFTSLLDQVHEGKTLTEKQIKSAKKRLQKYWNQLKECFTIDEIIAEYNWSTTIETLWKAYIEHIIREDSAGGFNPNPRPQEELLSDISAAMLKLDHPKLYAAIEKNPEAAISIGNEVYNTKIKPLHGYIRFFDGNEVGKKWDAIAKTLIATTHKTISINGSEIDYADYVIEDDDGNAKSIDAGKIAYKLAEVYNAKTISSNNSNEIYLYNYGIYRPGGAPIIKADCERIFEPAREFLTVHTMKEIIAHLQWKTYTPREELNADPWKLNLKNGIFDVKTMEFMPHTPNLFMTIRTPITYDETATCPNIDKFLSEIVYEEDKPLLEEMLGYCLYNGYPFQNWFLLYGTGGNGKSVFISLMLHFIGEENTASVGLQELDQRFANYQLYNKTANLVGDLSDRDLRQTGNLKKLTGGDPVTFEQKGRDSFSGRTSAKLIYSCNKIPATEDNTDAFFGRVVLIPFPNKFRGEDSEDKFLIDKLTSESELSGLFNLACNGLKRLLKNKRFSNAKGVDEVRDIYQRLSNPVYSFFEDRCELSPDGFISKQELYDAFEDYCMGEKMIKRSQHAFVTKMKLLTTMVEERKTIGGRQVRGWKGIGIREVDRKDIKDTLFPLPRDTQEENKDDNVVEVGIEKKVPLVPKVPNSENPQKSEENDQVETKVENTLATLTKNVCDVCGKDTTITECNGQLLCDDCLSSLFCSEDGGSSAKPKEFVCPCGDVFATIGELRKHQAFCDVFQVEQSKEAVRRMRMEEGEVPILEGEE